MKIEHPGLLQMPADAYHADEALGHSALLKILRSPSHYLDYLSKRSAPTAAFGFGKAVHSAVLEPELFSVTYAVFDEALLTGTLQSFDDYKAAADELKIKYDAYTKDDLKAAIKAVGAPAAHLRFRDDVQAELADIQQVRLRNALSSLDEFKEAAELLGIDATKLKKGDLKDAIKAADTHSRFAFRDDVTREMEAVAQERLRGVLQTVDDYRAAAIALGLKCEPLSKPELEEAIRAADKKGRFTFREDAIAQKFGGKAVLTPEVMAAVEAIKINIGKHARAKLFLSRGIAEMSGFWVDEATGVLCKCRPDWLVVDDTGAIVAILDLKTTRDASASAFSWSIAKYGYDVQAAFYTDGLRKIIGRELPFYFLAVESASPHAVALYRADDEMLEVGRKKYRAGLEIKQWCDETGEWPGYQMDESEDISLPRSEVVKAGVYTGC